MPAKIKLPEFTCMSEYTKDKCKPFNPSNAYTLQIYHNVRRGHTEYCYDEYWLKRIIDHTKQQKELVLLIISTEDFWILEKIKCPYIEKGTILRSTKGEKMKWLNTRKLEN